MMEHFNSSEQHQLQQQQGLLQQQPLLGQQGVQLQPQQMMHTELQIYIVEQKLMLQVIVIFTLYRMLAI